MSVICTEDEERRNQALASIKDAVREVFGEDYLEKTAEAVLAVMPDPDENVRLVHALHKAQAHPDFDYTTTTATAKVYPYKRPDGEGWELNETINGGCTRDEHNETWYWRRSTEYRLRAELGEREEARAMARNFQSVGGLLRTWMEEANALVDRERFNGEVAIGVHGHKLWHRIISNALGCPELPARLGPLFALQLNAVFGVAADELERHPEKRKDDVYVLLHDLAKNLFQADLEIKRK